MISVHRQAVESPERYLLPKECQKECGDLFAAAEALKLAAERVLLLKRNEIEF